MLAILAVHSEGLPHQKRGTQYAYAEAEQLADAKEVEHDHHDEGRQQASCKEEEVLRFQPLKLHRASYAFIDFPAGHYLQEEGTQDRSRHDEEDTGTEPRGRRLTRIRVTRGELVVDLDAPDEPYHSSDGVNQFRAGIKVARHHLRGFVNPCHTIALGIRYNGRKEESK